MATNDGYVFRRDSFVIAGARDVARMGKVWRSSPQPTDGPLTRGVIQHAHGAGHEGRACTGPEVDGDTVARPERRTNARRRALR